MEEKILGQLRWIKWLLAGIAIAFILVFGLVSVSVWTARPTPRSTGEFQEQAKSLLMQGKERDVLALAASQESHFPKDPYVFLYRGRAQFQLGDYAKAIDTFHIAESITPEWRDQYIAPYIGEAKTAPRRREWRGLQG